MSGGGADTSLLKIARALQIFQGIDEATIEAFLAEFSWRELKRGDTLLQHLDQRGSVYFVLRGVIRSWIRSGNGREVTLRVYPAGTNFGQNSVLTGVPRAGQVSAQTDCLIGEIAGGAFVEHVRGSADLGLAVIRSMGRAEAELSARVFELSALEVRYRIHAALVRLARERAAVDGPVTIRPAPTHAALAVVVGAAREAVTRELKDLERAGVVVTHREAIELLDVAYLEASVRRRAGAMATVLLQLGSVA